MQFQLTLDRNQIAKSRQKIVNQAARTMKIKGFRLGKAPINLVENQLDEAKIEEAIIRDALPISYQEYVSKNKLLPIGQPEIKLISTSKDQDWVFEITIAEPPKVELNDYQSKIKILKRKKVKNNQDQNDILEDIFELLLSTCQLEVPEILVNQEVNRRLSQLIEQVEKLGLTIEDYLHSVDKNVDQLRQEYQAIAIDRLKLEFILEEISKREKLIATDTEIKALIKSLQTKHNSKELSSEQSQIDSLRFSITRQKTLKYLTSLVPQATTPEKKINSGNKSNNKNSLIKR